MRRADRLFDIIQALRTAAKPVTARALAARLEVTERTVYRDIATLQARRLPIEGAVGVGYVLRPGFDLPPLMFDLDEVEAIAVGIRMLSRTGDKGLQGAAERVASKLTVLLPSYLRDQLDMPSVFVSDYGAPAPPVADLSRIRAAIRDECKLRITYTDSQEAATERTVWPFAIAYYVQATLMSAWCELRRDFRHFRVDRICALTLLKEPLPVCGRTLFQQWMERFSPQAAGEGQSHLP